MQVANASEVPFRRVFKIQKDLCAFFAKQHGECGIAARGTARAFGGGLRRSTVAHFARKVRGTNIKAAKHELKIHKVMPLSAGHVRYVFVALTLRAK